jgi:osmotically-inducible protein OsmY
MHYLKLLAFWTLVIVIGGCTTILVETTGPQGIQEDPTKRTTGARIEDQAIETKITVNIKSQAPSLRSANFDVVSHNGVVLIVGQVQSEQLKEQATRIASEASGKIKRIHNELEIIGKTGLLSRSNDAWISTKVRTQLLVDDSVPSDQVRVITENGSVFLMGIVTQQQGDNAAALARNVSGVTRVVKVFEYIN